MEKYISHTLATSWNCLRVSICIFRSIYVNSIRKFSRLSTLRTWYRTFRSHILDRPVQNIQFMWALVIEEQSNGQKRASLGDFFEILCGIRSFESAFKKFLVFFVRFKGLKCRFDAYDSTDGKMKITGISLQTPYNSREKILCILTSFSKPDQIKRYAYDQKDSLLLSETHANSIFWDQFKNFLGSYNLCLNSRIAK